MLQARTYERLNCAAAVQIVSLQTLDDLEDFCAEHEWSIEEDEGNGGKRLIVFWKKEENINRMEQVPSELLIKRSLQYARELEQIIRIFESALFQGLAASPSTLHITETTQTANNQPR